MMITAIAPITSMYLLDRRETFCMSFLGRVGEGMIRRMSKRSPIGEASIPDSAPVISKGVPEVVEPPGVITSIDPEVAPLGILASI